MLSITSKFINKDNKDNNNNNIKNSNSSKSNSSKSNSRMKKKPYLKRLEEPEELDIAN
ncbi:hypothetical protein J3Q64DRAFT_1836282 [Phycomyces blakesleeanus]|uniref:Uncharacterized protein n=1 Tax=Phycomyces blakesleeanus TaxID=4837 RepID=A0ABR3AWM1_PHYBL